MQTGNSNEIGFGTTSVDLNDYMPSADAGGGTAGTNNTNVPYNPQQGGDASRAVTEDRGGYKGVHPIAAFFHVAFKAGALLMFILGSIFGAGYVIIFVVTVLFIAADFWTTKNITGRLLVALRWWNQVNDDGSSQWVFESSPEADKRVNAFDSWFFWVTTAGYCGAWLVLCLMNLLRVSSLTIAALGFCLSGANLLGYVKCRSDARSRVTEFMINQATQNPGVVTQAAAAAWGSGK